MQKIFKNNSRSLLFILPVALIVSLFAASFAPSSPVSAATTCGDVSAPLPAWITSAVNANRPFYESAMYTTGVPWQMLAAIHYRETNFSHTNPNNGQGIFQFVNGEGGPYPPGPVSDPEFQRQLNFMASKIQNDYVYRGSLNYQHRALTANEPDAFRIQDTLFSYNGRSSQYAQQAALYRFNPSTQPYEGSPYVMNMFDCPRASMGIITQDNGGISGQDTRYGAFTLYARLKGDAYWQSSASWLGFGPLTALVKKADDPTFYLLNGGVKQRIPTADVYYAYGFDKVAVTTVSAAYLDNIALGNDLTTLARSSDGYIQLMTKGKRYTLTQASCTAWGLQCFNPYVVTDLDAVMFNASTWVGYLPTIMNRAGTIYRLDDGKKSPFLNAAAISQNGYSLADAVDVESINATQPLGPLIPADTTVLRLSNGNIVLYIDNQLIAIGAAQFYAWGFDKIYYPNLPPSSWDATPPTATTSLATNFIGFSTYKILIDSGRKLDLSSAYNDWPSATEASPYMGKLLNRLPLATAGPNSCFRSEDGDLFVVKDSKRRSFALYDDFYGYGCRPESLVGVYNASVPMLSRGGAMLTHNRMFKNPANTTILMETSPNSSVAIPSYSYLVAFGIQNVAVVDGATTSQYSVQGEVSSLAGIEGTGTYFLLGPTGKKYYFDGTTFNAWGVDKNGIPTYSSRIGATSASLPATRFARTPDGTIYYGSGGKAYKLATYDAFVRYGGNSLNTMDVLDDFIAKLPSGGTAQ